MSAFPHIFFLFSSRLNTAQLFWQFFKECDFQTHLLCLYSSVHHLIQCRWGMMNLLWVWCSESIMVCGLFIFAITEFGSVVIRIISQVGVQDEIQVKGRLTAIFIGICGHAPKASMREQSQGGHRVLTHNEPMLKGAWSEDKPRWLNRVGHGWSGTWPSCNLCWLVLEDIQGAHHDFQFSSLSGCMTGLDIFSPLLPSLIRLSTLL